MNVMKTYEKLQCKQADDLVAPLQKEKLRFLAVPSWIAYVRHVLHMSNRQLAKRLGISQSATVTLEQREVEGHVTLASLRKVAHSLECDLVYAFVPRKSFNDFVEKQEETRAEFMLCHTNHTMSLEQQNLPSSDLQRQKQLILEEIRRQPLKKLWDRYGV